MPELNKLVAEYKARGVSFIVFAPENAHAVKEFLKKHPLHTVKYQPPKV